MIFNSVTLLLELKELVKSHIDFVHDLKQQPVTSLQEKTNEASWSVVECIEHLNLYADFYNAEIGKRIIGAKQATTTEFKSGYFGNKFALDMLPKEGMRTMNTFKSKNPIYSNLNTSEVLNTFIEFQEELLVLLTNAEMVDLTKTKTAITLPILKFRLGDTFRFVIYHNERHIQQAKRVLK